MAVPLPYGSSGTAHAVALCQKMPLELFPSHHHLNGRKNKLKASGQEVSLDKYDEH